MTNQPPELLSDKELREKLVELSPYSDIPNEYNTADLLDLINQQTQAAEKRGELRGRIDCLKRLPTVRTHFNNGSASDVVLKSTIDKRLATLEAEAKE